MHAEKLRNLLVKCGVQGLRDRGSDFQACCPDHDERDPSWGISKTEPHFHGCFACGYKGTIVNLLVDKLGVTKVKAAQIAETKLQSNNARDLVIEVEEYEAPPTVTELWNSFVPAEEAFRYLLRRGLHKRAVLDMQARYDFEKQRVLFPWRIGGKIVGITGRIIVGEADPKYKTLPYEGTKKGKYLYTPARIFNAKDSRLVVVEGEIDAGLVMQDGYNVAALGFGTFTDAQMRLLLSWGFTEVILFTDRDSAGARIAEMVELKLSQTCRVKRVNYALVSNHYSNTKLDPGNLKSIHRKQLIEAAESPLSI